jgi:hypothetical protein
MSEDRRDSGSDDEGEWKEEGDPPPDTVIKSVIGPKVRRGDNIATGGERKDAPKDETRKK